MKLIFKKAKTKILLVVFLSFLLIYGCGKEEDVIVQPNAKTQNHEFFKHQKTGGDEFKSYILECLAQADDSLSFTGDFVKTYGFPQWDYGMHFGNEEYNSLIIPIYDQKNKAISALYYLYYQNQYIESFILMNDEDDAAYEYSKRLIQYFEKTLNLETSNKEFDLIILENNNSQTKSVKSNIAIDYLICDTYWYKASTTDFTHYWSEEDCFISTEYLFQEHHSSGDWASSNGGNYSTNSPYGGGSSGSSNSNLKDPEPYPGYNPAPPVVEDDSWKGTKADCIYDKIKNETSVLQNLLKEFMPSDSKFTLVFDIGYIPMDMSTGIPRQVNGKTYGTRSTNCFDP